MENARQETLAAQVGARAEGNAIVAPDVGERAPLGSLPPPAGVGGALWEAKRWLERTYSSMSSVRAPQRVHRLGGLPRLTTPWPPGADYPGSWLRYARGTSHSAAQGPREGCGAAVRPRRSR